MRASVVIAAHEEGEKLSKTIASCALACGALDHEIVVSDDASTDGSIDEALKCYPRLRVVRSDERRGASPAKAAGAATALGETLVFLDGHSKPEPGAIQRMVESVELLAGRAIVTPRVAALCTKTWRAKLDQTGGGYYLRLDTLDCGWLPDGQMASKREKGRTFFESPALIGCALAIGRELYDRLGGFDPHMRLWGVEDLDLGLRCWLLGFRILHDPAAVVAHRFQSKFESYTAPGENLLANQLRLARKNFTHSVWADWVEQCRARSAGSLEDHPEGLWARAWTLFEADRPSVEADRAMVQMNRVRDEFWYANRFGLAWPALATHVSPSGRPQRPRPGSTVVLAAAPSPSPSPPPCELTGISPSEMVLVCTDTPVTFTAHGSNLENVSWTAARGTPSTGQGPRFTVKFGIDSHYTVAASCGGHSFSAPVTVQAISKIIVDGSSPVISDSAIICARSTIKLRAVSSPDNDFPSGMPTWTIAQQPDGSDLPKLPPGPTATLTPIIAGVYSIKASCGGRSATFTLTAVTVTFESLLVVTGFTIAPEPLQIKASSKATVVPSSAVNSITIKPGGDHPERIAIANIITHGDGTITFDVLGRQATPNPSESNDCLILATRGDAICAKIFATVVVPTAVVPVSADGAVAGVNQAANATTSPTFSDPLPANFVHLWTYYAQWLTIRVIDQFGAPLNAVYAGVQVAERLPTQIEPVNINQTIATNGSYQDPVGTISDKDPAPVNVAKNSTIARRWPSAAPMPMQAFDAFQTIFVYVGGHPLSVGIVRRHVIATPPDNVQVLW